MIRCKGGKDSQYVGKIPPGADGNYSARVRAITPAGNGSWSNTVAFSLVNKEESTSEFIWFLNSFKYKLLILITVVIVLIYKSSCFKSYVLSSRPSHSGDRFHASWDSLGCQPCGQSSVCVSLWVCGVVFCA